jgi:DNA end-binding protein Ku
MARPIWTGTLGFGLVSVPTALCSATEDHSVHFHQLEEGTADRIRYRRVNERTGEEVTRDRIVRGLDVGSGEYLVLSDDELDAIAPQRSTTIEIVDFVDLSEIDPVYYDTTYYLAPRGDAAARAYALLRAAMEQTQKVGIALFVLRGKERVVAVRPQRRTLAMQTMYFADEVRDPQVEIPDLPGEAALGERELTAACMLIESLTTTWDPARYQSTYRHQLQELIDRKRHGETIEVAAPAPQRAEVVDLVEALQASIDASNARARGTQARGARGTHARARGKRRGRAAARHERREDATRRTTPAAPTEGDVGAMTKADLRALASELGISGRSRMAKDELEDAVRRVAGRQAS